jgi:hypothetical protein
MAIVTSLQGEVPVLRGCYTFVVCFFILYSLVLRSHTFVLITFALLFCCLFSWSNPHSLYFFFENRSSGLKMHRFISHIATVLYIVNPISAGLLNVSARAISPDNTCGFNGTGGGAVGYTCPQSLPCCSVHGFCGSGNAYCLTTVGCKPILETAQRRRWELSVWMRLVESQLLALRVILVDRIVPAVLENEFLN